MPDLQYSRFLELIDELFDDEAHDGRAAFMSVLRDRVQTDPVAKDTFVAWAWELLRPNILTAAIHRAQERAQGSAVEPTTSEPAVDPQTRTN